MDVQVAAVVAALVVVVVVAAEAEIVTVAALNEASHNAPQDPTALIDSTMIFKITGFGLFFVWAICFQLLP